MGSKILVTGASGFIGSHLIESLVRDGFEVVALVEYNINGDIGNMKYISEKILREVDIRYGDLEDFSFINDLSKGINIVYNLAALVSIPHSYKSYYKYFDTNVFGTMNLLNSVKYSDSLEGFIHTSSSEVYGTAQTKYIDENHLLCAQSPYAASKISADKLVESFYHSFEIPSLICRPFNTYGPRQSIRAVIPTIISQALVGNDIYLGNTNTTRDFTYISDTVEGIAKMKKISNKNSSVYNLGTGTETSIIEVVNSIANLLKKKLIIKSDFKKERSKNSEVFRLLSNNSKMKEATDWNPKINMGDGLQKTITFFRDHPQFISQID